MFVAKCLTGWGMYNCMDSHLLGVISSSNFSAWLYDSQRIWGNLQGQVHFMQQFLNDIVYKEGNSQIDATKNSSLHF